MNEKSGKDYTVEALAASGPGDLWLSADGAAIVLGLIGPTGKPNRRSFLETLACQPGFPGGMKISNQTKWRKSDLMNWADEQARINRAA